MKCPTCLGEKEVFAITVKSSGERGTGMVRCVTCGGSGEVSADYPVRLAEGRSFAKQRIERGENLFECSRRLGVSTAELSAFENGRQVASEIAVKIRTTGTSMVH